MQDKRLIGLENDREFKALFERYGSSCKNYLQYGPARRFYLSTHSREDTAAFRAFLDGDQEALEALARPGSAAEYLLANEHDGLTLDGIDPENPP